MGDVIDISDRLKSIGARAEVRDLLKQQGADEELLDYADSLLTAYRDSQADTR